MNYMATVHGEELDVALALDEQPFGLLERSTDVGSGLLGCACRYQVAVDELRRVYACHCHICQRWTRTAFSLQALVTEDSSSPSRLSRSASTTTDRSWGTRASAPSMT